MERMYSARCVALVITNLLIGFTFTEELTEMSPEHWPVGDAQWHPRQHPLMMWSSPFFGRSKSSSSYDNFYKSSSYETPQVDSLMDTAQESPWSMVSLDERKRHAMFPPRLGRGFAEEESQNWIQEPDLKEMMTQRSLSFSPRLGRLVPLTPRLGRRNEKQL